MQNDDLQFGFREKVGALQCSWLIQETLNYYLRGSSQPYLVSLDCTKAFPSCKWNVLFEEMWKQLPAVMIRVILQSYKNQKAYVKWGIAVSDTFEVRNGAAEGNVSSPVFWGLYILPLITRLRKLGLGCHIAWIYMASIFFAGDIILISPNRMAAQLMLNICGSWAKQNGITFSTDPGPSRSLLFSIKWFKFGLQLSTKLIQP